MTETHDDDLSRFEAEGAAQLPLADDQGYVDHDGARIWYATYGSGPPVILLHGGLGHSGNWGYQVSVLVRSGYRAIVIDSRGHGRSTRDGRPYTYELLASDVSAVMDALHLEKVALVGWSDGACTALVLAARARERVAGVFFFTCNMDPSGVKEINGTGTSQALAALAALDARLGAPVSFQPAVEHPGAGLVAIHAQVVVDAKHIGPDGHFDDHRQPLAGGVAQALDARLVLKVHVVQLELPYTKYKNSAVSAFVSCSGGAVAFARLSTNPPCEACRFAGSGV